LEYDDVLNSTIKKLVNESRTNATKNTTFEAEFTFTKLKWSGNSRKSNFRLAGHTLLNVLTSTSSNVDDLIKSMQQLSISELLTFLKDTAKIPEGTGLTTATNQLNNVAVEAQNISSMVKANSSADSIKIAMNNYFSNANSIKDTFSTLLKANSKSGLTEKIYVSSDTEALEVFSFSFFL